MKSPSRALEALAAAALLAGFTAMVVGEAWHQSATVDEFHLVPQAIALRATGDLELGMKTPPLFKRYIGLAFPPGSVSLPSHLVDGKPAVDGWAPWIFGTRFMEANRARYDAIFFRARLTMLPLAWALGLSLWWWARSIAGGFAGLLALALFSLSPEMISFSSLVSLDLAVSTLIVGAVLLLRGHLLGRRWSPLVLSSALFGLALSVKMSVVVLLPLLALPVALRPRGAHPLRGRLAALAIVVVIPLLALQLTYGFRDPVPLAGDLRPASSTFRSLASAAPAWLPIPVPALWLGALDLQARDVRAADVPSYLDGSWSDRGWVSYYLRAFLYKSPLPLLALLLLAAARIALERRKPRWLEATLVAAPALLWGGTFSLAGGLDIGIRYVLPCYALLFVGLAVVVASPGGPRLLRPAALGLVAILAVASVLAWPHHLGYFNVLAGGRQGGYRHLADSNVDWGQELKHLGSYLAEKRIPRVGLAYFGHVDPALYGIDYFVPDRSLPPGWYAISVNYLLGYPYLAYDHGRLRPIRGERLAPFRDLRPAGAIAGALMIYEVRGGPEGSDTGSSGGEIGSAGALAMSTTSASSSN